MRALYVWDADYPWDVRTEKVCAALTAAGIGVTIVARNRSRLRLREERPEATVMRMPTLPLGARLDAALAFPAFFNPRWLRHILSAARETRPAVIIVRDLPLCPTALWVGRLLGTPVILDMAENYPAMIRGAWEAGRRRRGDVLVRNPAAVATVERYCVARVDRIVAVVEESAERIARLGVPGDRVTIVSNTPPAARASRPRVVDDSGDLELVYLGLLEIPRGIGELLEATARLLAAGRRVRLRVIGDGRDRAVIEALAARLGLRPPAVEFLGYVPNAEALRVVGAASVGIVPHHATEEWNTTIPNKLFDYMAAGLPVVSSDAAPCARVVRTTGAGLVYRSGDADALAAALDRLGDPALRRALGEAGRRAVLERYNWESDAARLVALVRETAGKRSAAPPRAPTPSIATK